MSTLRLKYGRPRELPSRSETKINSFPLAGPDRKPVVGAIESHPRSYPPRDVGVPDIAVPAPIVRLRVRDPIAGRRQAHLDIVPRLSHGALCRAVPTEPGQKTFVRASRFHNHRSSIVGRVETRDDAGGDVRNLVEHDLGFAFEGHPVHIEPLPHQGAVSVKDQSARLAGLAGDVFDPRLRRHDARQLRRVDRTHEERVVFAVRAPGRK